MRWFSTLTAALLAEAAGHFLSLGWGFLTLILAFVVVAVRMSTLVAATNSKAYATEARLNAHVTATAPAVNFVANGGTVGGTVFVSGDHHVTGNSAVSGTQTITGQLNGSTISISAGMTDYGHTTHGSLSVDSNVTVGGTHTVTGQINGSTVSISAGMTDYGHTTHGNASIDSDLAVSGTLNGGGGSTVESTGIHSSGTILADGQINATGNMSAGNFGGPYQGGQGAVTVPSLTSPSTNEVQLFNGVNGCISRLNSSGLI
jgi:hypothetical protein